MTLLPLAGTVALASLAGSPHCAAMCGGFVCFYAGQEGGRRALAHVAYHAGRLVSYVALGAAAGALGTGVDALGAATGLHRLAAIASGVLLLLWGGATILGLHVGSPRLRLPLTKVLAAVRVWPPAARALALGLVTTLLPCGWLYLYAATAAGTGSPLAGAVLMAAFWLGTVPLLAGIGVIAQRAFAPLRRRLPILTGTAFIILGLLTITGKFHGVAHGSATCTSCHKP